MTSYTTDFAEKTEFYDVRAGSSAFVLMSGTVRPATTLRLGPPDVVPPHMRLWIVRLR